MPDGTTLKVTVPVASAHRLKRIRREPSFREQNHDCLLAIYCLKRI